MYGLRPSGDDRAENGRKKCPWTDEGRKRGKGVKTQKTCKKPAKKLAKSAKKCLHLCVASAKIFIRDTLKSLLLRLKSRARDHKKVQGYITRFGGTVTGVDDWGKKRLAYEIQKAKEAFYYFIKFESENSDCSNEVEAHIRIMEPVVRYLCVKQDEQ